MNWIYAILMFAFGAWILVPAVDIHLDDVRNAARQDKEDYRSKFHITLALFITGSAFICGALHTLMVMAVNS